MVNTKAGSPFLDIQGGSRGANHPVQTDWGNDHPVGSAYCLLNILLLFHVVR